jgi:hypothetical protein
MFFKRHSFERGRLNSPTCHGCHASVTAAAVTPFPPSWSSYVGVGGGVTAVTAELPTNAGARVCVCSHLCVIAVRRITRDSRDPHREKTDNGGFSTSPAVESVTAGFGGSRDGRDTATGQGGPA